MKRLMTTFALVMALAMFGGISSAFAADVFSDTFDGTTMGSCEWPDTQWMHGFATQNNEVYLTADTSHEAYQLDMTSEAFNVGSANSFQVTGTWSESGLQTGNDFYLNLIDNNGVEFDLGYLEGTGLGYSDGSAFNLATVRSLPTTPTNFALSISDSGWTYSENGTLVYSNTTAPFDFTSSVFTLGLHSEGSSASGQIVTVDNIKVTTTPEPVSCALFVLGGGALAFMRRRKA